MSAQTSLSTLPIGPAAARRIMIIGLDGATWRLARPWAAAGLLPTFRRLMEEGAWGALESVLPPVTPAAWSSFATGLNPGQHGLFDFVGRLDGSYGTYVADASHRGGVPLWQVASRAGRRVTVFNVPATYPPDRVNGIMVSGFLTPAHATDASWPPEVQAELARDVPQFTVYPPSIYSPGREAEFIESIARLNQATLEATRLLIRKQPWDLLVTVFMGSDVIQHFLWRDMERREGERAGAILKCYQQLDGALAELVAGLGGQDYLLLMSDHGFGPLTHYLHVNAWLAEHGYLRLKRNPLSSAKSLAYRLGFTPLRVYEWLRALGQGRRMQHTAGERNAWMKALIGKLFLSLPDVDWARTQAYSLGFGGPIFVNLAGREPQGVVQPGAEYDALLDRIGADLRKTVDPATGQPFVERVSRREELYQGAYAGRAPDLVFVPRDWSHQPFGTHEFASNRWLERSRDRSGTHRMDGLWALWGPGVRRGVEVQGARIVDIAPTVLALMGVPIPAAMDGRPLSAALEDGLLAELHITTARDGEGGLAGGCSGAAERGAGMSQEDEEAMREQLRGLGYVA